MYSESTKKTILLFLLMSVFMGVMAKTILL